MYDIKTIEKTLDLLDRYDGQFAKTARETGIKIGTIRSWFNKRRNGVPLLAKRRKKRSKWSEGQRKAALDYYFEHGENAGRACKKLGYPSRSMMRIWVREDPRFKKRKATKGSPRKAIDEETKKKAVADLAARRGSAHEVALRYGVSRETLYAWRNEFADAKGMEIRKIPERQGEPREDLRRQIKDLEAERNRLRMENSMLRKANELLKKEMGADYSLLSNREKALVVGALEGEFPIARMLRAIGLKKSTYFYERKAVKTDKYAPLRPLMKEIFADNYRCYGYRRMKPLVEARIGKPLSEKVVMRIMREERLAVYRPKPKKYSSYMGEISPSAENVIKRDFKAEKPFQKALTDITEFSLRDGKVYLSPMIDCFTGCPINWTIGKSPNSLLTTDMLDKTHELAGDSGMVIHSDRGFHYRIPAWTDRMEKYGYVRSMSKKGCSPDNSACEGFFGTMKNEFYYPNDWASVSTDEFIPQLEKYLVWFRDKRIKTRLGSKSSKEYLLEYEKTVQ